MRRLLRHMPEGDEIPAAAIVQPGLNDRLRHLVLTPFPGKKIEVVRSDRLVPEKRESPERDPTQSDLSLIEGSDTDQRSLTPDKEKMQLPGAQMTPPGRHPLPA
ncbi:MAG: hypothetical protein MPW14_08385 [Candidatus Manganitrophus sp.]|nr:MAG: hypothetical protein MPW14_08385 [Candidatus Manganitrophus sp.]